MCRLMLYVVQHLIHSDGGRRLKASASPRVKDLWPMLVDAEHKVALAKDEMAQAKDETLRAKDEALRAKDETLRAKDETLRTVTQANDKILYLEHRLQSQEAALIAMLREKGIITTRGKI